MLFQNLDKKRILQKKSFLIHSVSVLILFSIFHTLFFASITLSGRLLAPGDGLVQSVPAFYAPRTIWTNLLLSGFPVAADPTTQTWYPLSLLSIIPNSWNAFVISAYVLASSFSYAYVYTLTQSRLASLFSGLVYGMSGFMMAHLGHTSMIHTALWLPLIILALEKLRYQIRAGWIIVGSLAVACSVLAGHPQIFVYTIAVSVLYSLLLGWKTNVRRAYYYCICLIVLILGLTISSILLLPLVELSSLSLRSEMTFQFFLDFALPKEQIVTFLFPYFFGGVANSFYGQIDFGGGFTELTGYFGLLPLVLGVIGFFATPQKRVAYFWLVIAVLALLAALGDTTPAAELLYHLPVYNKFRVLARHVFEIAFAFSVLSGLGIAAIETRAASSLLVKKIVIASIFVFSSALLSIIAISDYVQLKARVMGIAKVGLTPWENLSLAIPTIIFLLAIIILFYWNKKPQSRALKLAVLLHLLIDLGSFGLVLIGPYTLPSYPEEIWLKPTQTIENYKQVLTDSHHRFLALRGGAGKQDEIPVNMSRLWGVPSISGYGPLLFPRTSKLLSISPDGNIPNNTGALIKDEDRSMDIMGVRFISSFQGLPQSFQSSLDGKVPWSDADLSIVLGQDCLPNKSLSAHIDVPPSAENIDAIGVVSSLSCATTIPNGTELLRFSLTDDTGKVTTQSLYAGYDTSEWSHDCPDVLPTIKHQRAKVWSTFLVNNKCEGHKYVGTLPLDITTNIKSIDLQWLAPAAAINIHKLNLISNLKKQVYPITQAANAKRWKLIENINSTSFYENTQVLPRAWLLSEVISLHSDEVLKAIQTSQLPDGRVFDPRLTALVEEPYELKPTSSTLNARAKIEKSADTKIEVQTSSNAPSFLVLSDTYYPGWQAFVDGQPTKIFQTNYVLRGVEVPAGEHTVVFRYRPASFHIGLGLSLASILLLITLYFQPRLKYFKA